MICTCELVVLVELECGLNFVDYLLKNTGIHMNYGIKL